MNIWFSCSKTKYASEIYSPENIIWCPAKDRRGCESHYRVIREVKIGDLILIAPDRILRGVAKAKSEAYISNLRPENAENYKYGENFFHLPLTNFQPFPSVFPLLNLLNKNKEDLVAEIEGFRPKYYLFSWQPPNNFFPEGRLQFAQGRFIAKATDKMIKLLFKQIDPLWQDIITKSIKIE